MADRATIHLDLAARRYRQMKTPAELVSWLAVSHGPTEKLYDPVKVYIESVYPDVTVQSGMLEVDFVYRGDPKTTVSVTIHPWHDRHLARVVGQASKAAGMDENKFFPSVCEDCDGYTVENGEYVATVETHLNALTPEPLSWSRKLLLSVLSIPDALRSVFAKD